MANLLRPPALQRARANLRRIPPRLLCSALWPTASMLRQPRGLNHSHVRPPPGDSTRTGLPVAPPFSASLPCAQALRPRSGPLGRFRQMPSAPTDRPSRLPSPRTSSYSEDPQAHDMIPMLITTLLQVARRNVCAITIAQRQPRPRSIHQDARHVQPGRPRPALLPWILRVPMGRRCPLEC